eukprot:3934447-Rhodomonas_salina.3
MMQRSKRIPDASSFSLSRSKFKLHKSFQSVPASSFVSTRYCIANLRANHSFRVSTEHRVRNKKADRKADRACADATPLDVHSEAPLSDCPDRKNKETESALSKST